VRPLKRKEMNGMKNETKRDKEVWRPVVGFEGLYEISSYGKLKRLAGFTPLIRKGYKDTQVYRPETILKSTLNRKGYLRNDLYRFDNKTKEYKRTPTTIHKLVAEAFIGPRPTKKHQVSFINGNKGDIYYKNLRYVTNTENQIHARKLGLRPPNPKNWDYPHGKAVNQLELGTFTVIDTFGSISEASRQLKIPTTNICKVLQGDRGSAGGYGWELFDGENEYTRKRVEKLKKRKEKKVRFKNLVILEDVKTGEITKYVNMSNPKCPLAKNTVTKYANCGKPFTPYNNTKHNNSYMVTVEEVSEEKLREMENIIW
jgi:hypothetical protein